MGDFPPAISYTRKLLRSNWHLAEAIGSFSPGGREGSTMNWIGDCLYVFGGIENGLRTNSMLKFDSQTHRWVQLPARRGAPAPRCQHSSWVIGTQLFIFAGEGKGLMTEEDEERNEEDKVYTVKQSEVFKDPNEQRGIRRICFDDITCFDTETETWSEVRSGLSPLPRKGHSSVIVSPGSTGSALVIFGGAPSGKGRPMNDLHTVDAESLARGVAMWSKKKPNGTIPSPRFGHACASSAATFAMDRSQVSAEGEEKKETDSTRDGGGKQGCMIIFGGTAGTGEMFNDVHVYDLRTNTWSPLVCQGQIPAPRYGHSAQLIHQGVTSSVGIQEPLFVTYGGLLRDGTEASFSRDLHVLHLKNRYWVQVKTSHLFPSPRYGHSLVLNPNMKAWYHGAPLPPKPTDRQESKAMTSKRDAANAFKNGVGEGLSLGTIFLFGGLNSMYCSGELWTAWLEMRNPGGQFAFTGNIEKPPRLGAAQQMIADLEGVVMRERKARLKADAHLMREREAKMQVQDECRELKSTIASLRQLLKEKEADFKTGLLSVQAKLTEEQEMCTKLRTELRESHNLLLLVDLSSNLRLQAWQCKARGEEPAGGGMMMAKSSNSGVGATVDDAASSVLSSDDEEVDDDEVQSSVDGGGKTMDMRGFPQWD
jgi:hypothetical protein